MLGRGTLQGYVPRTGRVEREESARRWMVDSGSCSAACAPTGRENVEKFLSRNFRSFCPSTGATRIVLATYLIELLGTKNPVLLGKYACLGENTFVWEVGRFSRIFSQETCFRGFHSLIANLCVCSGSEAWTHTHWPCNLGHCSSVPCLQHCSHCSSCTVCSSDCW